MRFSFVSSLICAAGLLLSGSSAEAKKSVASVKDDHVAKAFRKDVLRKKRRNLSGDESSLAEFCHCDGEQLHCDEDGVTDIKLIQNLESLCHCHEGEVECDCTCDGNTFVCAGETPRPEVCLCADGALTPDTDGYACACHCDGLEAHCEDSANESDWDCSAGDPSTQCHCEMGDHDHEGEDPDRRKLSGDDEEYEVHCAPTAMEPMCGCDDAGAWSCACHCDGEDIECDDPNSVLPLTSYYCDHEGFIREIPDKCKINTEWMKGDNPDKSCLNYIASKPEKRCKTKNVRENCGRICYPDICDPKCKDKKGKHKFKIDGEKVKLNCKDIKEGGHCNEKYKGYKMKDYCPKSCDSCEYEEHDHSSDE